MNDNIVFSMLLISLALFGSVAIGFSNYSDIKKAEAGLQECYVTGHQNPVWMKECKGE